MKYSALGIDQSMTATAWAHHIQGDKRPTGGLFPLPPWGDSEGQYLTDFRLWFKDLCWERTVTHVFFEDNSFGLDHHETTTQKLATIGLMAAILMVVEEWRRAGLVIDAQLVTNKQWAMLFWGAERAPSGLVKSQRIKWRKDQSIKQCNLRGWDCLVDGRENHNVADAHGILNYGLICIDDRWAANSGPMFNRASLALENEARELR